MVIDTDANNSCCYVHLSNTGLLLTEYTAMYVYQKYQGQELFTVIIFSQNKPLIIILMYTG